MRSSFFLVSALVAIASTVSCSRAFAGNSVCARTPELALKATSAHGGVKNTSGEDGYRIKAVRWDPLLSQHWAMIESCQHPERPVVALPLSEFAPKSISALAHRGDQSAPLPFPVIHAGDLVQMWRQEQDLRIEIAGRAEESAAIGSRVRIRLLRSGFEFGTEQIVTGIVRGPGDVEIAR
jgi:hypothetical protein